MTAIESLECRILLSAPGTGWQLVMGDEFDGTALNTGIWTVGTGARRDATNAANAVTIAGGCLTLTTYTSGGKHYTGWIGSASHYLDTFGYWEARIKFNDAPGMWSAFWLQTPTMGNPLGDPATAGTEIDIVEHRTVDSGAADIANKYQVNLHWDGYGTSHKSVGSGSITNPTPTSLQGNFHDYGMLWSPTGYTFYLDGLQVWTTSQGVSQRSEWIYLTSEVQNNSWAGTIPAGGYGDLTASTTRMVVDWVHVYRRPPTTGGIPDTSTIQNTASVVPVTIANPDALTYSMSVSSSNTNLVADVNLALGGSGTSRTITATPTTDQTGVTTIAVNTASGSPAVSATDAYTVTVNAGSMRNGGFESDPTNNGWGAYGGASVVTGSQHGGSRALRIVGSGGNEQVVTGLSPSTTYTLGGWGRVTTAGTTNLIGVKNYGGSQRTVNLSGTSYARGSLTFTTGVGNTTATVFCYKPTTADTGYFDDLYLFRAPTISAMPNATINANASTAPLSFTVGNVSSVESEWSLTASSSNTTLLPNASIILGGSGMTRTVTLTSAAGQYGTTTVMLSAADIYGGASTRSFDLTVNRPASMAARQAFYNNSAFDGNNPAADVADDAAIATDKQALLPGQTATFANYTSYTRGLNGIILDVQYLPSAGQNVTAADFSFRVGNDNSPDLWAAAPALASLFIRPAAGTGGSDRITLIWPDNTIQKQWLQVTMLATTNTGMVVNDVCYFGNAIAEAGNNPLNAAVDSSDELLARSNGTGLGAAVISNPYDYNRDKRVNTQDQLSARSNRSGLTPLKLITAPAAAGSAVEAGGSAADSVFSAVAISMPATVTATPDGPTYLPPAPARALFVTTAPAKKSDPLWA